MAKTPVVLCGVEGESFVFLLFFHNSLKRFSMLGKNSSVFLVDKNTGIVQVCSPNTLSLSPVQDRKRRCSGGLRPRTIVHTARLDGEDLSGGPMCGNPMAGMYIDVLWCISLERIGLSFI
jgi:hypothetical protein